MSTALGGYILTKFNLSPRNAILCLIGSWLVILASYFLGMTVGCDEPAIKELIVHTLTTRYVFYFVLYHYTPDMRKDQSR